MQNLFENYHSLIKNSLIELFKINKKIAKYDIPFSLISELNKIFSFFTEISDQKHNSAIGQINSYKNSQHLLNQSLEIIDQIVKLIDDKDLISDEKNNLQKLSEKCKELAFSNISIKELENQYQEYNKEKILKSSDGKVNQTGNPTIAIKASNNLQAINIKIEEIRSTIEELQSKVEENKDEISTNSSQINTAYNQLQEVYKKSIEFIDKSNNKIYELLSIASSSVVNGSYKENSLRELRTADRLRGIAIALMLAIVIFTSFSIYELHENTIDPWIFLLRVLSGIIFSVPAIYLTRESSKHRFNHLNYLQKSLDLAAFEPFIAGIGEEKQNELRSEMVKNIFFTRAEKDALESYPIDWNSILKDFASRVDLKNK